MLPDRFRTHVMSVERGGRTTDGAGGWVRGFENFDAEWGGDPGVEWDGDAVTFGGPPQVLGSLQPASASETAAADRERAEARWLFFCDPAEDIQRDDELTNAGRRFRVIAVAAWDAASSIDHMSVDLEQIQTGT